MTIPLPIIIAVVSGFMVIIGIMIVTFIHMYTEKIISRINQVDTNTTLAKLRADSAHDKVKRHVKDYHVAR